MEKPGRKLSKSKGKKPVLTAAEIEGADKKQSAPENEDVQRLATEEMDMKTEEGKQLPESPMKSATSSPVKKRARLSLKGNKSVQKLSSFFGPEASPREGNTAPNIHGNASGGKNDRGDNLELYGKPCVASLHNLGNTCFLNSVLQVLRHTPGFLGILSCLNREISRTEYLQDLIVAQTTSTEDDDEIMTWTLVKALDEVFEKMNQAEEKFRSKTSHYLAVRPYDMMTAIERINPMFEGNMQHDVHELLRCLLAYMEDAVRELNKVRSNYREMYLGDDACITLKSQKKELPVTEEKSEEDDVKMEESVIKIEDKIDDMTEQTPDVKNVEVVVKSEVKALTLKQATKKGRLSTPKTKKEGDTSSKMPAKGRKTTAKQAIKQEAKQESKSLLKSKVETEVNEPDSKDTVEYSGARSGAENVTKAKVQRTPKGGAKVKGAQNGRKVNRKAAEKSKKESEPVLKDAEDESGLAEASDEKVDVNDATKPASKAKLKRPRKLTNQAGQKKLNGFWSPTNVQRANTDKDASETSKSPKAPAQNGHAAMNGKGITKGPSTPKKKTLAVKMSTSSPRKDVYTTPEKTNIAMTASSPVTAKQIFAKHKMISEDNPASGDTPIIVGVDVSGKTDTTEDSNLKAALHSPTQMMNTEGACANLTDKNGVHRTRDTKTGHFKKSQRGRVVKCTPKAAALVAKASKKRKLSNDEKDNDDAPVKSPSNTASKARGRPRKSVESANGEVKENGKENAKVVNGKSNADPKQLNVLTMLKNPVPRKRLGVRGSVVRKPPKDDTSISDTSLNLSDQVDGCCDDPHLRDGEPFDNNPPDMVQEILENGAYALLPVYASSDESEMDGPASDSDSHDGLINDDVSDLLPPDDSYDSFDEYVTDSSDLSDGDCSDLSDFDDKDDLKTELEKNSVLAECKSKETRDKRAFSTSPDSGSSQCSLKLLQKKLRLTENTEVDLDDESSEESDVDVTDALPQLDGVFDDWKIPRPKQTARKSCPPDRATVPVVTDNGHGESGTEARRDEEIRDAVAHANQAFVKLSTSDVPSYLQQQVLATIQSHITQQGEVRDSVKSTFEGDMALRTRCLECENFSERKEAYQDISLAVKKTGCCDDSDGEEAGDNENEGSCGESSSHDELEWLRSALADVESLDGDNKYYCDRCCHLTEAQRSMHYLTMPRILTLHLKRFAATNGFFGGLTKINDHVPTPLELPCIQDKCGKNCSDPAHRYTLYGIITHTGISICSGHYVAYVKVTDKNLWRDVDEQLPPDNSGLQNHDENNCVPMQTEDGLADPNNNADTNNNLDANDIMPNQNAVPSSVNDSNMESTSERSNSTNSRWLECDDDTIRVLSNEEFEEILSNSGAGTPYMLFYHTVLDQFEAMRV